MKYTYLEGNDTLHLEYNSSQSWLIVRPGPVFYVHQNCARKSPLGFDTEGIVGHPEVVMQVQEYIDRWENHSCDGSYVVEHRQVGQKLPKGSVVIGLIDEANNFHLASNVVPKVERDCVEDDFHLDIVVEISEDEKPSMFEAFDNCRLREWLNSRGLYDGRTVNTARSYVLDAGADGVYTLKGYGTAIKASGRFAEISDRLLARVL